MMIKHRGKYFFSLLLLICALALPFFVDAQIRGFDRDTKIFNRSSNKVVNTTNMVDPIRDGIYSAIQNPEGDKGISGILSIGKIDSYEGAQMQTIAFISNIINFFLGLVSFVALGYLIYHGYMMVTAGGDDGQYNKGLAGIRYGGMAIVGIGLSWFIVAFIFFAIEQANTVPETPPPTKSSVSGG